MASGVPRVERVGRQGRTVIYVMTGVAVALVAVIVAMLQGGLFGAQPATPQERNIVLLERALKEDPDNATVMIELAENYYDVGRRGPALEYAARAAEIAPEQQMINLRFAQMLLLTGDLQGAETYVLKELDLPGTDSETSARFILAQIYREQGRLDEAIYTMEIALAIDYQAADYRKLYAAMLLEAGMTDEAIAEYQLVLQFLPDDRESIDALASLGVTYDPASAVDPHSETTSTD